MGASSRLADVEQGDVYSASLGSLTKRGDTRIAESFPEFRADHMLALPKVGLFRIKVGAAQQEHPPRVIACPFLPLHAPPAQFVRRCPDRLAEGLHANERFRRHTKS